MTNLFLKEADLFKPFDAKDDDKIAAIMAEMDGEDTPQDSKSKVGSLQGF